MGKGPNMQLYPVPLGSWTTLRETLTWGAGPGGAEEGSGPWWTRIQGSRPSSNVFSVLAIQEQRSVLPYLQTGTQGSDR